MPTEVANKGRGPHCAYFSDATASRLDGLRLDWPDRWLLIRASNTEPIVRIIAEAPDEAGSRKLCADAASAAGVGGE